MYLKATTRNWLRQGTDGLGSAKILPQAVLQERQSRAKMENEQNKPHLPPTPVTKGRHAKVNIPELLKKVRVAADKGHGDTLFVQMVIALMQVQSGRQAEKPAQKRRTSPTSKGATAESAYADGWHDGRLSTAKGSAVPAALVKDWATSKTRKGRA